MRLTLAALAVGLALAVGVAAWCGIDAVADALARVGWLGLLAVAAFHLLPKLLCGAAWWLVQTGRQVGPLAFLWFRWLRDGANDLLGIVPAAGEIVSVRAMTRRGIALPDAVASTIVDLTVEMAAQCLFILSVLLLLAACRFESALLVPAAIGLGTMAVLLVALVLAQRRGAIRLLGRIVDRLTRGLGSAIAFRLESVHAAVRAAYADRRRVAGALACHLAAWWIGVGEGWLGLALLGQSVGPLDILLLETLAFVLRSAGFVTPGAIGIQEGGYVLLAPLAGVPPEAALALSLLKRGREILLGLPACIAWRLDAAAAARKAG